MHIGFVRHLLTFGGGFGLSLVGDTIIAADIATGAVTTAEILDATIVDGDIANATITAAKLALANDSISGDKIDGGTVSSFASTGIDDNADALALTIDSTERVGIGTASPAITALLDVSSTTKGFLPPRMTSTQRDAITSPALGLTIYNTTNNVLELHNGTGWVAAGQNVPTGMIMAFASTSCPAGWTEYTAARGRFLRGIDNGAGNDPDGTRAPGNAQTDDFKSHTHTVRYTRTTSAAGSAYGFPYDNGWLNATANYTAGIAADSTGGAETRPRNIATLYCQFSGGIGTVATGANQILQGNSSLTVTDSGSDGTVSLATEGVDRLSVSASGNVGIGTTSPGAKLDVQGMITTGNGAIRWKTYAGTTGTASEHTFAHGLAASKIISIDCNVQNTNGNYYNMTYMTASGAGRRVFWDATLIHIDKDTDNSFDSRPFRCVTMYVD
jgi:hypothetical protein